MLFHSLGTQISAGMKQEIIEINGENRIKKLVLKQTVKNFLEFVFGKLVLSGHKEKFH